MHKTKQESFEYHTQFLHKTDTQINRITPIGGRSKIQITLLIVFTRACDILKNSVTTASDLRSSNVVKDNLPERVYLHRRRLSPSVRKVLIMFDSFERPLFACIGVVSLTYDQRSCNSCV